MIKDMNEIVKDGPDSYILTEETKGNTIYKAEKLVAASNEE